MADIPDKLEWDSRSKRWVPYEGTPGRATAEWDPFSGTWDVVRPEPQKVTGLGQTNPLNWLTSVLPASAERGLLERQQALNIPGTAEVSPELAAENIAELERRKRRVERPAAISAAIQELGDQTGFVDVVKTAFKNPEAVLSIIGEGLGASVPDLIAGAAGAKAGAALGAAAGLGVGSVPGAVIGGALGTGAGFGISSGIGEYGQFILGRLQREGIDLSNPAEVGAALKDPELMNRLREGALASGLSVGALNAAMGGLSGNISRMLGAVPRAATKYEPAYTPTLGRRLGAAGAEVGTEVGLGGAGGAISGYIDTGEVSPVDVVLGAATGIPFAARESYRTLRGTREPLPGIPTRTEFTTREEAEQALKERGLSRPADQNLSDAELEVVAERVVDAQTPREVLEARGPEQLALPAPRRAEEEPAFTQLGSEAPELGVRETPFGRLSDKQVDEFLLTNKDLPGMREILGAENVSVEARRAAGLDLVRRQSGMETPGKVPYVSEEGRLTAPERAAETPIGGVGALIARPSERVYAQEAAREVAAGNRATIAELPRGATVGPDQFNRLTLEGFSQEGYIRPIPDSEFYVRVNEPETLPPVINREEYRAIVDKLSDPTKFEPGDPVTVSQVRGIIRTERGKNVPISEAKEVLNFLKNNEIVLQGRDEQGKPALLNNYKPTLEYPRTPAEAQPVPASLIPETARPRRIEPGEPNLAVPRQEAPARVEPAGRPAKVVETQRLSPAANILENAKQQVDKPVEAGVKNDRDAAVATKEVLPKTAEVYEERATVADNREKDMQQLNGGKGEFADAPEPKLKPVPPKTAPLDSDGLTFMSWFQKHIFTLDYTLAVVPRLKAWGSQIFARDQIATQIRREARDAVDSIFSANPKQVGMLTDVMEAHSHLGKNAVIENLPDGGIRLRGKAEDLKAPLQRGRVDVDITMPKDLADTWRMLRKTFDDFWNMRRQSELERFGFSPDMTPEQLAKKIADDEARLPLLKDAVEAAELRREIKRFRGLESYLELTDGYREGYLPHVRRSGKNAIMLVMKDQDGVRHVLPFDHPFSVNRARKAAETARKELISQGWTYENTVYANLKELNSTMRGAGRAIDQVENLVSLLMNGRDDFVKDASGKHVRTSDQMFELLGDLRKDYLAETKMGGRLAKTKFVPGYMHKWNRDAYLRGSIAEYFGAGAEYIANNRTWRKRSEELNKLRKTPDLYNYAVGTEEVLQSPDHASAVLRAIGFHSALGFNLSSAMLNAFQLYQSTLPYLAGMGGTLKASRYTMGAAKDVLRMVNLTVNPDEVFSLRKKPSFLTEDEFRFVKRARDLGKFDPILMREFSGDAETLYTLSQVEQRIGNVARKVGQVSSLAFSAVEQGGRLSAMLAAYRMFKNDPKAFAKAQKFSVERGRLEEAPKTIDDMAMFVSDETMFNMTKANRPAFMRGMWSVPFQFSQYPLMMLQLMARVAGAGGRGVLKTKEGGLMLGLMLAGVWTTAGVLGLPGVQQAASTINVVSKDLAPLLGMEPTEAQNWLRENLAKVLAEIGLPSDENSLNWILKGGFRQLTGISTEKRTALDWPNTDMLSPDILNFTGPGASIVMGGVADAVEYFKKGQTGLGIASLMPNLAARNLIRAMHAKPGVFAPALGIPETGIGLPSARTGESPIKPFGEPGVGTGPLSTMEFLGQTVGFTPARVADIREAERAVRGEAMEKARRNLTEKLATLQLNARLAEMSGNSEQAGEFRNQYQNIIRQTLAQDRTKESPRDRLILDAGNLQENVLKQLRRKLEGPFGMESLKRFREAERPYVLKQLRELYGVGRSNE